MVSFVRGSHIPWLLNLEKPMATMNITMYEEGSDEPIEVAVPARWAICGHCSGDGKSSSHLGAITADEWNHDWHPDEQEAYLRGEYDQPCGICGGRGSVLEPDVERCNAAEKAALAYAEKEAHEAAADRRMMWYESGCPQ